ncbi:MULTISPECIES: hypothetical protein [Mammaliicoccus]|uniref:hypothetical protein n=1 Tax=Mammaliicoccus sp. JADD-157 TaxID=3404818 RepID=UPI0028EB668D|nr:hypothetical protein [Mammaliicoccus lentus]
MWKLKEFRIWGKDREIINDFMKVNKINLFKVVGYRVVKNDEYIPNTIMLIKYWEEDQ